MPSDLLSRPLIEIAGDLHAKRVTARELVEAAIARHERFGERLHGYSLWAPEQALAVARAADEAFAAGLTVGPLQGIPVSIKDLFAVSGYPCFAGSSAGYRPTRGNRTARWWRRCAASSVSSWARPIWSSSRSEVPAKTVIGAGPTTRGMRPRIVPPAVRPAAPASVCWKVPRCSPLAATRRARYEFRRA